MNKEGKDLSDYIINSDLITRRKLLKDKEIRKELLKDKNHYAFVWVVQSLTSIDIDYFLDDDIIEYLKNDNPKTYKKIDAILENVNSSKFLSKENILFYLVENFDYFKHLDINFGNALFSFILKNSKYIKSLSYLNKDIQYEILSKKENIDKLIILNTKENYLYLLDSKVINILLNRPYYYHMFLNTNIDIINEYYIKNNIELPSYVYSNELINKYLEIKDVNKYRNYINNINNILFKEEVETKRKKYYIDTINNINNGLLPIYNELYNKILNNEDYSDIIKENSYYLYPIKEIVNDKDKLLEYLRELSTKEMLEITIDMYFEDISYNFLKNLHSMLEYISLIEENIIEKEHLSIYLKLINYYNLTIEERIDLFNELNDGKDYVSIFYDDFRLCRNHSYNKIKNSTIDINKFIYSDKYNTKIYELNGEDFFIAVHHTTFDRNNINTKNWDNYVDTLSISLISHNNFNTFRDKEENIILGFDLDINNIIHIYESDSFTDGFNSSNRVQRIFTNEELINRTKGYNEILIRNKDFDGNNNLFPSYVVCFNEIKDGDLDFSKKYNLPIVLIKENRYNSKKKEMIDIEGDQYIDSYSASYLDIDTYKKMK